MQRGPERGVADEDGRLRLLHHHAEVRRARVVVGLHPVLLGEQQLGEAHRRAGGRTERHPGPVQLPERPLGDDHARHDGAVAAHGDVGEGDEVLGVPEVLDEGDGADVEVTPDEALAELLRGVLRELEIEERSGPRQAPVKGQAVQELDVSDAGPAARVGAGCVVGCIVHIARLDPPRGAGVAGAHDTAEVGTEPQIKHVSDVIFPSTVLRILRARLNASCSLVSLAVQSLRSM